MDEKPSSAALEAAGECRREGRRIYNRERAKRSLVECEDEAVALALARFRAEERERPADKILRGLRGALSATQLTNAILDLLPPHVVTPQLQNQIIVILSPHVSGEPS